jgi:hypothetical protein
MTKIETQTFDQINIKDLKKHNVLSGGNIGSITWNNGNSMGIDIPPNKEYLRLFYSVTNHDLKQTSNFDYKVSLLTTPCFFGGSRFWFECPVQTCKKRVGILYQSDGMFKCRHCHNLTYSVRNLSGIDKIVGYAFKILDSIPIGKYFYYKNKPTKRYLQYLKKEFRADTAYKRAVVILNKKIEKVMNSKKD